MNRGIRNNNPTNIRRTNDKWRGLAPLQQDRGFFQFSDKIYAYRATFIILSNYMKKGVNTIGKIIRRWAPASDNNDTNAYITFVCRTAKIDSPTALDIKDKKTMVEIVRTMTMMESGFVEDLQVLNDAYDLAFEDRLKVNNQNG